MDAEIAKQAQKILGKQGIKFKLNTKVTSDSIKFYLSSKSTIHSITAKGMDSYHVDTTTHPEQTIVIYFNKKKRFRIFYLV